MDPLGEDWNTFPALGIPRNTFPALGIPPRLPATAVRIPAPPPSPKLACAKFGDAVGWEPFGEGGGSFLPAYHPTTRAGGVFKIRDRRMRKPPESNFRAPKPLPHFASCSPTSQGADSHEGIVAAGRKRVPQVSAGRNHGRRQIRGARRLLVRKRKPPPGASAFQEVK